MTMFKNSDVDYKIESTRLQNRSYSIPGRYFITICTHQNRCYFGNISQGQMVLSHIGNIAETNLKKIVEHFSEIIIDSYIVMPNHIHALVIIKNQKNTLTHNNDNSYHQFEPLSDHTANNNNLSIAPYSPYDDIIYEKLTMSQISKKGGLISQAINSYKGSVTRECRRCGLDFSWHPRFHDRILRQNEDSINVREYMRLNPMRWWNKFHKAD